MVPLLRLILRLLLLLHPSSAVDFLYNSFTVSTANITLTNDARLEPPVIRLTNDSNQSSIGRAFYPTTIPFIPPLNFTNVSASFSTQFVFSILPQIATTPGPGFGLAFVISNSTSPPNALAGQFFGLFSSATGVGPGPLLAVEFDTGRNSGFNDADRNHVGVNLNSIVSASTQPAGYYNSNSSFVPLDMRSGQNIHAWIDFSGPANEINITIAPAGMPRPARTLLSYQNPDLPNYFAPQMFVGFSASTAQWVEAQRVLAWSFSNMGLARDLNTTGLPVFRPETSGSSTLDLGLIAGVVIGCVVALSIASCLIYLFWWRRKRQTLHKQEEEEIEQWEMEYWPHRFSYNELHTATKGFSDLELLGSGGFGKVYKATLANNSEVAVKCVNHDSQQGLREFMAEISSIGRLQHKNLVPMRGWCRKRNELMLVYDFMPNGSLNQWIFKQPKSLMNWAGRKRVFLDVAEGLNYLHNSWDLVVVHRDIKSGNVLLDSDMRGRLGDFGLAKLYTHGEAPNKTRLVGTLGYMAPEVVKLAAPTAACDVYSFGMVVLEVVCGRRPLEVERKEEEVLLDWVRDMYLEGRLGEVADPRMKGEYEVEEMEAFLKLGLSCCHPDPARRPNMRDVAAVVSGGQVVEMAPNEMLFGLTFASDE